MISVSFLQISHYLLIIIHKKLNDGIRISNAGLYAHLLIGTRISQGLTDFTCIICCFYANSLNIGRGKFSFIQPKLVINIVFRIWGQKFEMFFLFRNIN